MKTITHNGNPDAVMYNKIFETSSNEIIAQSASQNAESRTNKIISVLSKELLNGPIDWLIRF